jgi:predicted DNA-binding transcriptional regulator YafY/CTP:molybdopterin cytidylyltransferase MocA
MRASRLLSILLLLQTRGRLTAAQLAAELEVSVRTIYRDVDSLHAAGVPLYGDAGRDGGYQLLDGYQTRLTGLTGEEAQALFLAGMPGPAAELGLGTVVAAAQLKLTAALPAELRDRAQHIQERFLLDAPGWYHDGDETPHLAAVADAVWRQKAIRVRYHGGRHLGTYRVNQVLDLTILDESFQRPDGFDLAAHWRDHINEFRARLYEGEALVRLSPLAVERLPDLMGPEVVRAAADGVPEAGGWVRAQLPIESLTHAETQFLKLGAQVEVLEPAQLRDRLTATARDLAALYAPPRVAGLLLAAGEGRRYGMPKALVERHGRLLVERAAATLREGGCDPVVVVLGAAADTVRERADLGGAVVVDNPDWAEGMGSSLRVGLATLAGTGAQAAAVLLVDTPGITAEAVRRVIVHSGPQGLRVATYQGRQGHPVLLGRAHWAGVAELAAGDVGARPYLAAHRAEVTRVACEDIADGTDLDHPDG